MKWIRCRRCRTLIDLDRMKLCPGCRDPAAAGAMTGEAPPVEREAGRDRRKTTLVLIFVAFVAAAGLVSAVADGQIPGALRVSLVLVAVLLAGGAVALSLGLGPGEFLVEMLKATLMAIGVLAGIGVALVLGLIVLIFAVCSQMRVH